jgi:hypothetical protein
MHIDSYSFGNIIIDGKSYTSDLIIFPDHVQSSWWRLEGHLLQIDDLKEIIAARTQLLIVGTGYHGTMKVPGKTLEYLKSNGVHAYIEKTGEAVKLFNALSGKRSVIVALHLTC